MLRQGNKAGKMPHKRAKAVGKLIFFDNKTTPRSIDRFGFNCYKRFLSRTGIHSSVVPLFSLKNKVRGKPCHAWLLPSLSVVYETILV